MTGTSADDSIKTREVKKKLIHKVENRKSTRGIILLLFLFKHQHTSRRSKVEKTHKIYKLLSMCKIMEEKFERVVLLLPFDLLFNGLIMWNNCGSLIGWDIRYIFPTSERSSPSFAWKTARSIIFHPFPTFVFEKKKINDKIHKIQAQNKLLGIEDYKLCEIVSTKQTTGDCVRGNVLLGQRLPATTTINIAQ